MKMNPFEKHLLGGVVFIIFGIVGIVNNIRRTGRKSSTHSLLRRFLGKKLNCLINLIVNICGVLFGVFLIFSGEKVNSPIVAGVFFILIGIESMSGDFSGRRSDFAEERFSEKTNFIIGLITSVLFISVGIGILVWRFFISKG